MKKLLSLQEPKKIIPAALSMPDKVLLCGIDLAKDKHVARVLRGNTVSLKERLVFSSDDSDLNLFVDWILSLKRDYNADHLFIGMEPTADFWGKVYNFLICNLPDTGTWLVHPHSVSLIRKLGNSNFSKTDDIDALAIAKLVGQNDCFRPIQHSATSSLLKEQFKFLDFTEYVLSTSRRKLIKLVGQFAPDLIRNLSERKFDSILSLLDPDFSFNALLSCNQHDWVELHLKKGHSRKLLLQIHKELVSYYHILSDSPDLCNLFKHEFDFWLNAKINRNKIVLDITSIVQKHPLFPFLSSIPGIGVMTAGAFIASVGDVDQFCYANQIIKLFGFDLRRHQSGKMDVSPHISKRGVVLPRKYFYMAALSASRIYPFKIWYDRKVELRGGKGKRAVVIALAAKLIRISFQLTKNKELFDFNKSIKI